MSGVEVLALICGLAIVTYIPRVIPALLSDKVKFGKKTEKFLKLIPYTAMSALIVPGVITVDSNPIVGVVGGGVAVLLAVLKCPVIVCVLAAIGAEMLLHALL